LLVSHAVLMDCNSQIESGHRAAISGRSQARGGVVVDTMATTSNNAVAAEGKRDAFELAVGVH
jgi:hypothetical protein